MSKRRVDAIIVGAGQGGSPLALELASRGNQVVLFEEVEIGGTCVNTGCTPSKAFLAAAHTAQRARRGVALGVRADVEVDFPAVMQRVAGIVQQFREPAVRALRDAGVQVVHSHARFVGERTVRGRDVTVEAPLVIINSGASPFPPPIRGLNDVPYLDNTSFFLQRLLPERLMVVGGGYIGLELGQGMARCGSIVSIFHSKGRVLDAEEPAASDALSASLAEDGVRLHLDAQVVSVQRSDSGLRLDLADGTSFEGEALLVATGRRPNSGTLDLHTTGVKLDARGYVAIDEQFATSCQGVYAIGDVAGQPPFTHVSWEDHRRLLSILDGVPRSRNDRVLAYSTFTDPQVARVGATLEQARASGMRAVACTIPLTDVGRAIEWGERHGFFRIVVDAETDKIVGATLVGYETAELIHVMVAHIAGGSKWQALADAMHVHPTYAEGLPALARLVPRAISEAYARK